MTAVCLQPDPSKFDYSQMAYIQALDGLVKQLELPQPFDLVVQVSSMQACQLFHLKRSMCKSCSQCHSRHRQNQIVLHEAYVNRHYCWLLQGFILGQYAMLWAMQHPDQVEKIIVLNTPLGRQCKLRPELAAYKNKMSFLRPDPQVSQPFLSASECQHMACCTSQAWIIAQIMCLVDMKYVWQPISDAMECGGGIRSALPRTWPSHCCNSRNHEQGAFTDC